MSFQTRRDVSRRTLLAALHPQAGTFAAQLPDPEDLDWNWMIERAKAHKVTALFASRVAIAGCAAIPEPVAATLTAASADAKARNVMALGTLRRAARSLDAAGVKFMLVKGSLLAEHVYDNPAQRRFFDVDLVVPAAQVDSAQAALARLGYRLWGAGKFLGREISSTAQKIVANAAMRASLIRYYHELSLVAEDPELLPIDLHWHIVPPQRLRVTANDLWLYVRQAQVGGMEIRTFDPEATLLHLAAHALPNRPWGFRLLHLVDFAWAAERLPIDPQRLHVVADAWGAQHDLARAAALAERVLGAPAPSRLAISQSTGRSAAQLGRVASAEALVDRDAAAPQPEWTQLREDIAWGWAMGTLRSTAVLLFGKYAAVLRFIMTRRAHALASRSKS